jgi:glutaredoxin 3
VSPHPSPNVTVYTTSACGYCIAAKMLLKARGVSYDEVDVSRDEAKRTWLVQATGRKTVPQIFIAGNAVGGYEELAVLDRTGRLAEMLVTGTS